MVGTGICEVADAELMDTPQSLNFGAVEQFDKPAVTLAVDADVVVKRVPEDLGGHAVSRLAM